MKSHKQASYQYINLSFLQLSQNSIFFLFLSFPFRFRGLWPFSYVPTRMILLQKGWFVVFPTLVIFATLSLITLIFSLVIPSIPPHGHRIL